MTFAYPRVSIEFCTKCKWNLRAAWYLQELLSTFGSDLGEVALLPASAGTFIVTIVPAQGAQPIVLWNRVINDGFPDSKELKRLVRDVIQPNKDLGHVDRHSKPKEQDNPVPPAENIPTVESEAALHGEACPNIN